MELDALILIDEYEPEGHLEENLDSLFTHRIIPKVLPRSQFHRWYSKHQPHLTKPHLIYMNSSQEHYHPSGLLDMHRKAKVPAMFSSNDEFISVNPSDIRILEDGRIHHTTNHLKLNVPVRLKLPKVDPPLLMVLCHNRHQYFELTLNGILSSLGEYVSKVPIALVLSGPTNEVREVALAFQKKHEHIDVLEINENTPMGAVNYTLQWYQGKHKHITICEDDFILPPTVKNIYPAWPWFFVENTKKFDVVSWAPSLDNLPLPYKRYQINGNDFSIIADHLERKFPKHQRWINSFECEDLFACGNSVTMSLDFYIRAARCTPNFCPIDRNYENIARGRCAPALFGYHIGWNQEQDGYLKLNTKRWNKTPDKVLITDLRTKEERTIETMKFMENVKKLQVSG